MRANNIIWMRIITSIIIATLLCPNSALAGQEDCLAAQSRLSPFFEKHGLEAGNISKVVMSAARIKKVLFENRGINITAEIEELNRFLSSADIEIEPGVREYVFRGTRKKVKYVVFNFRKNQKKICALFIKDYHRLNKSELEEIGIKEEEEHYLECPGLEEIWFVNQDVLTNRYQDRLNSPNKELQVISSYFNYDFLEILRLHGSIFDVDMFFSFLKRKLKWITRDSKADAVWNLKFICGDSITAKDCRIEGESFYIEIKEKEDNGKIRLDIRIYNKETGELLKTIDGLRRLPASSRGVKRIEAKIDISELMSKKIVFIGENHRDTVAKNWLLRNLGTLKENGVKVIGLEMFDIEYQDKLDAFMRGEAGDREILDYLYREWGDSRPNNSYLELLKEMRKYGIQPVAIRIPNNTISRLADRVSGTSNQEYNQYHDRFMALKVIRYAREKLQDGKMLVLLGYQHISGEDCTYSFVRNDGIDSSAYIVTNNLYGSFEDWFENNFQKITDDQSFKGFIMDFESRYLRYAKVVNGKRKVRSVNNDCELDVSLLDLLNIPFSDLRKDLGLNGEVFKGKLLQILKIMMRIDAEYPETIIKDQKLLRKYVPGDPPFICILFTYSKDKASPGMLSVENAGRHEGYYSVLYVDFYTFVNSSWDERPFFDERALHHEMAHMLIELGLEVDSRKELEDPKAWEKGFKHPFISNIQCNCRVKGDEEERLWSLVVKMLEREVSGEITREDIHNSPEYKRYIEINTFHRIIATTLNELTADWLSEILLGGEDVAHEKLIERLERFDRDDITLEKAARVFAQYKYIGEELSDAAQRFLQHNDVIIQSDKPLFDRLVEIYTKYLKNLEMKDSQFFMSENSVGKLFEQQKPVVEKFVGRIRDDKVKGRNIILAWDNNIGIGKNYEALLTELELRDLGNIHFIRASGSELQGAIDRKKEEIEGDTDVVLIAKKENIDSLTGVERLYTVALDDQNIQEGNYLPILEILTFGLTIAYDKDNRYEISRLYEDITGTKLLEEQYEKLIKETSIELILPPVVPIDINRLGDIYRLSAELLTAA